MAKQTDLETRIEKLEARNHRVEGDKAWETSWVRRLAVMVLTYLTVCFYLHFVIHINPWINALVPVIGFGVSTLTLQRLKQLWLQKRSARRSEQ